jgi:hypothetical protein
VKVRIACFVALIALASCGGGSPVVERSGILQPGGALVVSNIAGDIDAYAPARNQPADHYSIEAFAPGAQDVSVSISRLVLNAQARTAGVRFQVRAPGGTSMNLTTRTGNINVQDYDGVVNAATGTGDIKMLIPAYGNAFAHKGNVSVIFSSVDWNGTLHFGADDGNVEVYVNENAKARIRMHTDDGTVFSDFDITGTSSGTGETIDAPVNGGGPRGIDVEVRHGDIRVMQLKPQV